MRIVFIVFGLAVVGCGSKAASDAGEPACVPNNGVYMCLGVTLPVCPGTANELASCNRGEPACMGCYQGAGFTCSCDPADAGLFNPAGPNPQWECIGTGYSCDCAPGDMCP